MTGNRSNSLYAVKVHIYTWVWHANTFSMYNFFNIYTNVYMSKYLLYTEKLKQGCLSSKLSILFRKLNMTVYPEPNSQCNYYRLFYYQNKLSNVNRSLFFILQHFHLYLRKKHTGAKKINSPNAVNQVGKQ